MADPISPEYHQRLNDLAAAIDYALNGSERPKRVGFCLLQFEFGITDGSGRVNYISNAGRRDMIVAVKEWLARAEGRAADVSTVQ